MTVDLTPQTDHITDTADRRSEHRPDPDGRAWRGDSGQATTEYALILLAAALVGLLVVAWATAGGAAGRIGQLFDSVVDAVMSRL